MGQLLTKIYKVPYRCEDCGFNKEDFSRHSKSKRKVCDSCKSKRILESRKHYRIKKRLDKLKEA